jgi:type I restriction enzyme S subunit
VRTYLKNIATVPRELSGALTSTGIAVLRSSALMDSSYLFHWVTSDAFVTEISKAQDGTMYPAVSDRDVLSSRIAVPPLTEQRRIVAKLDSLTGGTTRAREQLGRIPRLISKYREAILSKAFEGVFVGLSSAGQVTLSAYVKSLDQGWSPKCESSASDDPKDWAVIKTTAIQPIHFFACENKKLPPTLQPRPNIQIQAGDVLITRAGPRSRVGISCVVTTARPHLMLCDKAYRIRAKDGKADPTFLAMMLNSPQALRQIEEMKTGISDSGLNLTQEKFLNLSLPKLNLEQQQTTVRRIETAFAWLDRVAAEHANASRLLPKLDQAILAKAFRGELISQNSTEGGNLVPPPKLEGNPHRQSGANRQRT